MGEELWQISKAQGRLIEKIDAIILLDFDLSLSLSNEASYACHLTQRFGYFPFFFSFLFQGKSLFMPLRLLLTGKVHGPDMGSSVILLHKAGSSGVVSPNAGFVPLNERFEILRQVDWEALKEQPPLESAATVSN